MGVPLAEKTKLEVFGKGSGEEPFSRKVCPSSRYKLLYEYRLYPSCVFRLHTKEEAGYSHKVGNAVSAVIIHEAPADKYLVENIDSAV